MLQNILRAVFVILGPALVFGGFVALVEGWEVGFTFTLCFNAFYTVATGSAMLVVAIKGYESPKQDEKYP